MPDPTDNISSRWWRPENFTARRPFLESRRKTLRALHDTMDAAGFTEVQTPILQISPGIEAWLYPFETTLNSRDQQHRQKMFLRFAPELALKKLLVAGVGNLYEMARVFRDTDFSSRHQPEFLMLEWYRINEDYRALMQDCMNLVRNAARASARERFQYQGHTCDPFAEWEILRMPDAFSRYAGIDLLATMTPHLDAAALIAAGRRAGVDLRDVTPWDDAFFQILAEKIEPYLGMGRPTILCDYPAYQTVLTRPCADMPVLAERFELYVCGLELANGMSERTDPVAQREAFRREISVKKNRMGIDCPVDEDFLTAQDFGMPECSGIGLGVERLAMLCAGAERIDDVLWAPVISP